MVASSWARGVMRVTLDVTLRSWRRGWAVAIAFALILLNGIAGCDRLDQRPAAKASEIAASSSPTAAVFSGRVIAVTDGDTVKVLVDGRDQRIVRLAEIDAPEKSQPWGNRSRQALSALVFGKTISVQQTDTDRYGRVVARLFVDSHDVNRAMVEQGHAWAYRQYLTDETLVATEARARARRVGLWSMSDQQTVAPWEWRQGARVGTGNQPTAVAPQGLPGPAPSSSTVDAQFSCSGKRFCRQMSSCAEAHFYLERCAVSSLDGNDDGEPCEQLCGTINQ